MTESESLVEVVATLVGALRSLGEENVDRHLQALMESLNDGSFFERPPEQQLETLRWYDEAYLGRGDLISGLLWRGVVSKGFPGEMRAAFLWYLITLDLPDDLKSVMRDHLSRM